MTSQVIGSRLQRQPKIMANRAGLAFGLLLGGLHVLWALLVATDVAQPLMDLIFRLHFIRPVYVIEAFEPLRAAGLVLLTMTVGYGIGAVFSLLWNRFRRSQ